MRLRLDLSLEIDTTTHQAVVLDQRLENQRISGERRCPGPCGGTVLKPTYQHCSRYCRTYMREQKALTQARAALPAPLEEGR